MNCHEDAHSLRQCRQSFINASGCLNQDLGQLGDGGGAYRRQQQRMNRYRREEKSSRSNKKPHKQNRSHRGDPRGQHQGHDQAFTHNDGFNTHAENGNQQSGPGHHGGVRPSPASSSVAPSPGVRYGASHNPGGTSNVRPSALETDKPTAIRHLPRVRRQHCREKTHLFHKMLVLQACPVPAADQSR